MKRLRDKLKGMKRMMRNINGVCVLIFASYMIENQKEKPQGKPKSTPTVIVIIAHSTFLGGAEKSRY